MNTLYILIYLSSIAFLFFGTTCLFTPHMRTEFTRFGLTKLQRQLTGVLQLVGAVGLLLFKFSFILAAISATGLSLLMLMGFIVRMRVKDSVYESSPAFIFMVLNAIIAFKLWLMV